MTPPEPHPQAVEREQRRQVSNAGSAADHKSQDKPQDTAAPEREKDDPAFAPESGDKPEADERK